MSIKKALAVIADGTIIRYTTGDLFRLTILRYRAIAARAAALRTLIFSAPEFTIEVPCRIRCGKAYDQYEDDVFEHC